MRIKSTVKISTFLIISVVLIYSTFAVVIDRTVASSFRDLGTASDIRRIFDQLRALSTDYVLYETERAHQQWWAVQVELLERLNTPEYRAFQREYHLVDLDDRLKLMGEAFTKLTAAMRKTGLSPPEAEANKELHNRLITQIMVISREINVSLERISEHIGAKVVSIQQRSTWLDVIALLILGSFIIVNSIFLLRSVVKPVLQLHEGTKIIGSGNLDYRVETSGQGEIRELSRAFNEMTANLQNLTVTLQNSEESLRFLASQLLTVQEEERSRLSRDLHDDLGQALLVLKMQLNTVLKKYSPEPELRQSLEEAITHLLEVIERVRRLSRDLSPAILESLGLSAALRSLFEEFKRYHNQKLVIEVVLDEVKDILPKEANIVIYRIAQEFLSNVHKHAEATRVAVTIKAFPEKVAITLEDNGKGFVLEEAKNRPKGQGCLGLVSMEERLRMLGSQFSLTSQAGKGTRLYFEIFRTPGHEAPGILAEAGR